MKINIVIESERDIESASLTFTYKDKEVVTTEVPINTTNTTVVTDSISKLAGANKLDSAFNRSY